MDQHLATWWSVTSAYLAAPAAALNTPFQPLALVPVVGILCLVVGLALALRWRQRQALWMIAPGIIALLTPITITLAFDILGWVGLGFMVIAIGLGMLIWIGVIASDADRRRSIWLLGFFELSYVVYTGAVAIAFIWGL